METYFYEDHASKACVTPCPNLVTESQNYAKSVSSEKKRATFGVLFCEEALQVLVDILSRL